MDESAKLKLLCEEESSNEIIYPLNYNYNISILKCYIDVDKYKLLISLMKKKIYNKSTYIKRLIKEFKLINYFGFEDVFLQVSQILEITKDYPHIIRGSAGSCLFCFYMEITNIDPVKENISLSRFMHKKRQDIPDIDIDFPSNDRDLIYKKIFSKWKDKVARISNHIKFKEKSAIREAIRSEGYNKFIPKNFKLNEIFNDKETINKVKKKTKELIGNFRCYSLHCGGIIIFKNKVPDNLVLKEFDIGNDGFKGKQIWMDKDQVEEASMIKIDILSNRGLSQLIEIENINLTMYPKDDFLTYKLFEKGNNIGITHSESRAMMKVFRTIKPKSIKELAISLALIRPAASKNYQKSYFLKDYTPYKYDRTNYLIFDDDATKYIKQLIKCNDSDADLYRRAFSKNKKKEKNKFIKKISHLQDKNNIIERLEQLEYYSFCKSHAYSYAQLIYCLAYQKVHNPIRFWLSTLNNCNSSFRKWVHFREAVSGGIKLQIGKKPFTLKDNLLIPKKIETNNMNSIEQLYHYGYWSSDNFLQGLYYREFWQNITEKHKHFDKTIVKDNKIKYATFNGLIATGRVCKKDGTKRYITFVTIGTDNGIYHDLVLFGYNKIAEYKFIKGYGKIKVDNNCKWIEVHKFTLS